MLDYLKLFRRFQSSCFCSGLQKLPIFLNNQVTLEQITMGEWNYNKNNLAYKYILLVAAQYQIS